LVTRNIGRDQGLVSGCECSHRRHKRPAEQPVFYGTSRKLEIYATDAYELKSSAQKGFPKRHSPSEKPPQNRRDLPDDLSVGAIPELLRANPASWIAMNDEIAFIEGATTA
jgi:hypothetical protein